MNKIHFFRTVHAEYVDSAKQENWNANCFHSLICEMKVIEIEINKISVLGADERLPRYHRLWIRTHFFLAWKNHFRREGEIIIIIIIKNIKGPITEQRIYSIVVVVAVCSLHWVRPYAFAFTLILFSCSLFSIFIRRFCTQRMCMRSSMIFQCSEFSAVEMFGVLLLSPASLSLHSICVCANGEKKRSRNS